MEIKPSNRNVVEQPSSTFLANPQLFCHFTNIALWAALFSIEQIGNIRSDFTHQSL